MTRELFGALLHEQGYEEIEVNESFLKKLQIVIDYYPGIGSLDGDIEKTIVGLAGLLGRGIILDMYGAAKERKDLLERRRQVKLKSSEELCKIDRELERLEGGREE